MDVVKEGTGNCNGTGVICDGDGTDELEEAIDIEDEIPEAISFPPIKTEQEVRVWVTCEVVAAHAVRPFMAPKKCSVILHSTISCFVLYCGCSVPFEIWIAI